MEKRAQILTDRVQAQCFSLQKLQRSRMKLKNIFQFSEEQEAVLQQHQSIKLTLIAGQSLSPMHARVPIKVESYKGDYLALR